MTMAFAVTMVINLVGTIIVKAVNNDHPLGFKK